MRILTQVKILIINNAKICQIISIVYGSFGILSMMALVYMLYIKDNVLGEWLYNLYNILLWGTFYQIIMGIIATVAFSTIRKGQINSKKIEAVE